MKVLLTGATGFLGSHLLKGLLREGHEVAILKRSSSNCRRIVEVLEQCRTYDGDQIPPDAIFQEQRFDIVIHCATEYKKKDTPTVNTVNSNLIFPLQILEAAISANCPYFINTDTFFTKQIPERFEKKQALYAPEYTLSKYQFREWGQLRAAEGKVNFINLQMEHLYGPDDGEEKFITFLIRAMRNGAAKLELTDGIQIRDFVYVDDAVAVYLAILTRLGELSGYCHFEVGTGVSHTIRELVEKIHTESGASTRLNFGSVQRKDSEIMFSTASREHIRKIGRIPKISFESGIYQTVKWYEKIAEKGSGGG